MSLLHICLYPSSSLIGLEQQLLSEYVNVKASTRYSIKCMALNYHDDAYCSSRSLACSWKDIIHHTHCQPSYHYKYLSLIAVIVPSTLISVVNPLKFNMHKHISSLIPCSSFVFMMLIPCDRIVWHPHIAND